MGHWQARIEGLLGEITSGAPLYMAKGELRPGPGPVRQSPRKPAGLPVWQVYADEEVVSGLSPDTPPRRGEEDAKRRGDPPSFMAEGADTPGIRFLALRHFPAHPGELPFQGFSAGRGQDAGIPVCIPLGEGTGATLQDERGLSQELLAHVLFRPIRLLGICRSRFSPAPTGEATCEVLACEVYSETGSLLWTHPRLSLDLILKAAKESPLAHTAPSASVSSAVQVPVVPRALPPVSAAAVSRLDLSRIFDDLSRLELGREDIIEIASRSTGVPLPIVAAAYAKRARKREQAAQWTGVIQMARRCGLDGAELVQAAAASLQVAPEAVQALLDAPSATPASAPSLPMTKPSMKPFPKAPGGAPFSGADSRPHSGGISRVEAERLSAQIASRAFDYREKAVRILAVHTGPMEAGALRAALGIPTGGTGAMKLVADAFRRNIIKPLLHAPVRIVQHGTQRATVYTLAE